MLPPSVHPAAGQLPQPLLNRPPAHGLQAAHASGAYTVGIRSSADDATLRTHGAHVTIEDFTDPALPGILSRLTEEATQ